MFNVTRRQALAGGGGLISSLLLPQRFARAAVGSTLNIVPAQIDDAINGNVLVSADRLGLALGVEMIAVVVIVMTFYWMLQRRARRWQQ